MEILSVSIDLTKIDKAKIVTTGKDGQPFKNGGKFYNFDVIVKDDVDTYGNNVSLQEKQTKEQREAKADRVFLGNGKRVFKSDDKKEPAGEKERGGITSASDDDLAF